jgi:hypothetical protein
MVLVAWDRECWQDGGVHIELSLHSFFRGAVSHVDAVCKDS